MTSDTEHVGSDARVGQPEMASAALWLLLGGVCTLAALSVPVLWSIVSTDSVTGGAALFVAGTVLWLVQLSFTAATVAVATATGGRAPLPDSYVPVQAWAGTVFEAACGLLGLALVLYGLAIRASDALSPVVAWLSPLAGALVLVTFGPLGGTPPFLVYLLATLPLGVAALVFTRRRTGPRGATT